MRSNSFRLLPICIAFICNLGLYRAVVVSSHRQGSAGLTNYSVSNGKFSPYFTLSSENVSEQCQQDLDNLLAQTSGDALLAIDAFGKPGSGILVGDVIWLGTYDECQQLQQFHYCLVDLKVNLSDVIPPEKMPETLPPVISARWGTCFPQSCNGTDVLIGVDQVFDKFNIPFPTTVSMVHCSDPVDKWADGVFVFTVVLCCILACLMLGGYGLDVFLRSTSSEPREISANGSVPRTPTQHGNDLHSATESAESTPLLKIKQDSVLKQPTQSLPCRFLLCFALNRNLSKLLDTHQNDRSILCVNGIRALSMSWVILAHVFVVIITPQITDNMVSFGPIVQTFGFQAILAGPYAVDTFFLLSGLLVTLGCINRMERCNGKIPWLWFYFHRYWRLTPALGFIILITMTQQYIGEGPVWLPTMRNMATHCKQYWWSTLLYINNFYPTSFSNQCVGHSWYLSNDMQFFVISPVFIILLYKFKKLGLASIAITCLISFSITATLMVIYDVDASAQFTALVAGPTGTENLGSSKFNDVIYQKPYCRIPVYLVGMVMGLIIQRQSNRRIRLSKLFVVMGWLFATVVGLAVVYGLYPAIVQGRSLTPAASALHGALSRFSWGIMVAWVIFACYSGYAGPIDNFLSWRGWIPVSRLTYTAYLIHLAVIYQFYMPHKVPWHLDLIDYCYYFVGVIGLTYGVALVFSLAIEYPFANMEKLFLPNTMQSNQGNSHKIDETEKKTKETNNTSL